MADTIRAVSEWTLAPGAATGAAITRFWLDQDADGLLRVVTYPTAIQLRDAGDGTLAVSADTDLRPARTALVAGVASIY